MQKNRKLVIGVQLDTHVQKMLMRALKRLPSVPVRMYAAENWHVPLFSLGWIREDALTDVVSGMAKTCCAVEPFALEFESIAPQWKKSTTEGGEKDIRTSHALWLHGVNSEDLRIFYGCLLDTLQIPHAPVQKFAPHVVLGRMRQRQLSALSTVPSREDLTIAFPLLLDFMSLTLFEETQLEGKRLFVPVEVFDLGSSTLPVDR